MKLWLEINAIKIYLTHNAGKSLVAKRFITTLKNEIDKYLISILKNAYIVKLDGTVNKYNNTHSRTIKMKHVEVKEIIRNVPNSKLVIMLNYQNIKIFLKRLHLKISLKKFL